MYLKWAQIRSFLALLFLDLQQVGINFGTTLVKKFTNLTALQWSRIAKIPNTIQKASRLKLPKIQQTKIGVTKI